MKNKPRLCLAIDEGTVYTTIIGACIHTLSFTTNLSTTRKVGFFLYIYNCWLGHGGMITSRTFWGETRVVSKSSRWALEGEIVDWIIWGVTARLDVILLWIYVFCFACVVIAWHQNYGYDSSLLTCLFLLNFDYFFLM
jgi:hypothetical protein